MTQRSMQVAAMAAAVLCGGVAISARQPRRPAPARAGLERLAGQIVVLSPEDFLYGFRESYRLPDRYRPPLRELARFVEEPNRTIDEFLPLLDHSNPKVRTLALIALYSLEDPKVLPRILPLVTDGAATFLAMQKFGSVYPPSAPLPPDLTKSQTVGEIATEIMNMYLKSGGYLYGPLGMSGEPGFRQYWNERGARDYSAGWWSVWLDRAGHGTRPTPLDTYAAIRALRAKIDRVPEPDRTYTLLMLHDEAGADILVSRLELVESLKRLGTDAAIDLVRRRIRTDDPDLLPSPRNRSSRHGVLCGFVLQNAGALLRSDDAKTILEQEAWERDFQSHRFTDPVITPLWAIAAAQLDRANAASILRQGYTRFQGTYDGRSQLELAHALWTLGDDEQARTVADWVYKELDHHMGGEADALAGLLQIGDRSRGLRLAGTIIDDPRFDDLNWKSIETLVRAMSGWTGRAIVSERDLESTQSPLGSDFFMKDRETALARYPSEIGELLARLARWRGLLRDAIHKA